VAPAFLVAQGPAGTEALLVLLNLHARRSESLEIADDVVTVTIATMAMTVVTPTTIPRIVRAERSL
jgi:hypothetical protein